jgi:nucleoside-diphosphate-sugar epimerase
VRRRSRGVGKRAIEAEVRQYRVGDIRHCVADIRLARDVLGYRPQVTLDSGMHELADGCATGGGRHVDAARASSTARLAI